MITKLSVAEVEEVMGPLTDWAHQCHAASIKMIQTGLVQGRVARGWCRGVSGQHSWVVVGKDCYAMEAEIVDPTLWSYDSTVEGIWYGTAADGRHHPHGAGLVWEAGKPGTYGGPTIELDEAVYGELSRGARHFLDSVGELDARGWMEVAQLPVNGWPAEEIILAMHRTRRLTAYVPIDRLGMLTDVNPGGAYLKVAE